MDIDRWVAPFMFCMQNMNIMKSNKSLICSVIYAKLFNKHSTTILNMCCCFPLVRIQFCQT